MSFTCNFSSDDPDCSQLFECVHVSITIIRALFAMVLPMLAVPTNVLLIIAMITHHRMLDKVMVMVASLLIMNTLSTASINIQALITSLVRAWTFGYWGCQVFSVIAVVAQTSRYTTGGLLIVSRFCKVVFPHFQQGKLLVLLLVISWAHALLSGIVTFVAGNTDFDVSIPGCLIINSVKGLGIAYIVLFSSLSVVMIFIGTILPVILYTIMYIKVRLLRNKIIPAQISTTNPQYIQSQKRWRRASITYGLLVLSFSSFASLFIIRIVLVAIFERSVVSRSVSMCILFVVAGFLQCYTFVDFGILLFNKDILTVFLKLVKQIKHLLVCKEEKI